MSVAVEYRPFGSLLRKVVDNRGRTCPVVEQGIPLIATNCILNSHLYPLYENVRYVSDEVYVEWFRGHPEPGDMIFVLKGSPGRVAWVPDPVDFCIAQDMVAIRADEAKIYPKYLFAVLRSETMQQEIDGLHVGSLIPHFKKGDFDDLRIPCVDHALQKYIGDQYFDLSTKVDLLHRQNKTLEAMAETLFRQWFVEGAGKDWQKRSLLEFVELVGGGTPKTSIPEYWDGDIPWLSGGDIATNHKSIVCVAERNITRTGLANSSAKLLPKWATVITARGTVGRYALLAGEMAFSQSNYGILPRIEKCYLFTYLLVGHLVEELQAAAYGTVFDTITTATFRDAKFVMPPLAKVTEFERLVKPYFDKKLKNETQIGTLETLRDALLPKLMSGEVRVRYDTEAA